VVTVCLSGAIISVNAACPFHSRQPVSPAIGRPTSPDISRSTGPGTRCPQGSLDVLRFTFRVTIELSLVGCAWLYHGGLGNPGPICGRLAQLEAEITAQKAVIQQLFSTKKFEAMPMAQHQLAQLHREYNIVKKQLR
jgi:hypothetical protein